MKEVKNFIKIIPALLLFPIADPRAFFTLFLLLILTAIILSLPIIVFIILIGLELEFNKYVATLWKYSGYDTKLLAIVSIIGIVLAGFAALPIGISVFCKIRECAWSQLEKNNIHHRGKNLFQTTNETPKQLAQ